MRFIFLWLLLGAAAPHSPQKPGLVILCRDGVVMQYGMGSIASGRDCVLHDDRGRALSVTLLSAYNDEMAAP